MTTTRRCNNCSKNFLDGWDRRFCNVDCYIVANTPAMRNRLRKALDKSGLPKAEVCRLAGISTRNIYNILEANSRGSAKSWKRLQKVLKYPLLKKNDNYREINAKCEWCGEPFFARLTRDNENGGKKRSRFCGNSCLGWNRASQPDFQEMIHRGLKKSKQVRAVKRERQLNVAEDGPTSPVPQVQSAQVGSALYGLQPYEGEALINWFATHATYDQLQQLGEEFPQIRKKLEG